jgi:hypothetical protein
MGGFAERLAAAQALVVALVLLWSGVWKIAVPRARALARQSALTRLLGGGRRAEVAHLAVGGGEVLTGFLLLAAPGARLVALGLASFLTLGFLAYLALSKRIAPDAVCACMAGKASPVSWRSLTRAGLLLALSVVGFPAGAFWGTALAAEPWLALIVALELAGIWALSPESGDQAARLRLGPAGRAARGLRQRLDPTCARVPQDTGAIERALRAAPQYRSLQSMLDARTDAWREGCWDYLAYSATFERQPATVIFVAPALFDARDVSAAVVADSDHSVLLSLPSRRGAVPALS